ncbi:hypothetical protein [Pseudomonas sp. AL03]|uniref:hypothetical protein n=1 Tax=Pseudomonas sp. AL03 TaxID=3042230 RepID=UPI00249CC546|nr:hypothetical protein [Pseudomonas sp. AL03]MDI3274619.1 hypothetical protein [Pseudomonas sp. AL03]
MLAIDHHRTRAAAGQLKLTDNLDKLNDLLVDVSLGAVARREDESVLDFADLHPVVLRVSASLIQRATTERLRPRQFMKLLNNCQHKINAS